MMISQTESQLLDLVRLIHNPSGEVAKTPEPPRITVLDMLKQRNLRLKLILSTVLTTVNAMVYMGIAFYSGDVRGNRFTNFIMFMSMEIPSGLAIMLVVDRLGRIWPTTVFIIIGGVAFISASFIPTTASFTPVVITLIAIAKFGVSASFGIICQVGGELFPTPVRGTCLGMGSLVSNMFVAIMPLIIGTATNKQLPTLIMGIMSIFAGSLGLFLPETMGTVLPETLEDAEFTPVGMIALKNHVTCKAFRKGSPSSSENSAELKRLKPDDM